MEQHLGPETISEDIAIEVIDSGKAFPKLHFNNTINMDHLEWGEKSLMTSQQQLPQQQQHQEHQRMLNVTT